MSIQDPSKQPAPTGSRELWTDYDEYLTADMLDGKEFNLTVTGYDDGDFYDPETRGKVTKPILYFAETEKGLVLTRINRRKIMELFGKSKRDCIGKVVTLYIHHAEAFGEMQSIIRIKQYVQVNRKA